jgi:hypothetical protein
MKLLKLVVVEPLRGFTLLQAHSYHQPESMQFHNFTEYHDAQFENVLVP